MGNQSSLRLLEDATNKLTYFPRPQGGNYKNITTVLALADPGGVPKTLKKSKYSCIILIEI